MTFEWSI